MPGAGLFKLHDTHGIPIEITALLANERGMCIDWTGFKDCALVAGWSQKTINYRLRQAAVDAGYNQDWMTKHFGEPIIPKGGEVCMIDET